MALRSLSQKILATSFAAAVTAGGVYSFTVSNRVSLVDKNLVTRSQDIPESFITSNSAGQMLNAKKHVYHSDWRFITLDIPTEYENVSDQVLLAKFVKGFFAGAVIRPERVALQTVGTDLVHFSKQAPVPRTNLWSLQDIPETNLLPINSVLFGVFQVLDSRIADLETTKNSTKQTESYVDFGFGDDSTAFAGVHRFTVVRPRADGNSKRQKVQIHFQNMTCNPTVNKHLGPQWLMDLHEIYADYLFRDGVAEIKRWMGQ
ncbi:hypothetical protein FVEN_g10177 [Fusarium venenatum]|uniref:Uncharacterized protein n=1 Tax=Fusarium venenatum TaxID=56646 RepID=A0A2L2TZG4_9HYPO|nr:uncharacterized protein FVRRES_03137 [Fusarium venenatum]KAG8351774.1 hypothetical protein FVEN_g10177 [Fusarium venenatum]KAH7003813.1 hypothetical protein EDB82DRAFT_33561 [Fusarium venenatum]CEI66625.1 unnamed protein product [Fusarium venenatum]